MNRVVRLLVGLALSGAAVPLLAAEKSDSLKGDVKEQGDLKFARIELPAKDLVGPLVWADDKGSAFWALTGDGTLTNVSFPDFEIREKKVYGKKCSWLAVSKEGLLVTSKENQEVWVIDPSKLSTIKKKIAVPSVGRAVSAPSLSIAVAASEDQIRGGLSTLDLATGKSAPMVIPPDPDAPRRLIGYDRPVFSPDGKYLFTEGFEQICRFSFAKGKWKYEDCTTRIAQGYSRSGIVVSPDSKFVCIPTGGGNYGAAYATYVYRVAGLQKHEMVLDSGAYPGAVGFDPAGKSIYANNATHALIAFASGGQKQKEYKLGPGGLDVSQFLVHPSGNKVIVRMKDYVYYAETPKPE